MAPRIAIRCFSSLVWQHPRDRRRVKPRQILLCGQCDFGECHRMPYSNINHLMLLSIPSLFLFSDNAFSTLVHRRLVLSYWLSTYRQPDKKNKFVKAIDAPHDAWTKKMQISLRCFIYKWLFTTVYNANSKFVYYRWSASSNSFLTLAITAQIVPL